MNDFSSDSEVEQDVLTCQQGNLFLADMSDAMINELNPTGHVNGDASPCLPSGEIYQLTNTVEGSRNTLQFTIKGRTIDLVRDIQQYHIASPDQVKAALSVEEGEAPDSVQPMFRPSGAAGLNAFSEYNLMNSPYMRQLQRENGAEWVEMMGAYQDMEFRSHFGRHPLALTSDLIRYAADANRRLQQVLNTRGAAFSDASRQHLEQLTSRFVGLVHEEVIRRENPGEEGLYCFGLDGGAEAFDVGSYRIDDVPETMMALLGECISKGLYVKWDEYAEVTFTEEAFRGATESAGIAGALNAGQFAVDAPNKALDLAIQTGETFRDTRYGRQASRLANRSYSVSQWAQMRIQLFRDIVRSDFEITTSHNGQKVIMLKGDPRLRVYLHRRHYPAKSFHILDSVTRTNGRGRILSAGKQAFTGTVAKIFIVFAGVIEFWAWMESDEETIADLIARLGLVILMVALTAIISTAIVSSALIMAGVSIVGISFTIAVGAVSIIVGALVTLAIEISRLRHGLAAVIRFIGSILVNMLGSIWSFVLGDHREAMAG